MLTSLLFAVVLQTSPVDAAPLDCTAALTTIELNECAAADVEAEEVRMRTYLARAIQQVRESSDTPELGEAAAAQMAQAQTAWEAYVEAECGAVYTQHQGGTIRVLMALGCKRDLVLERTTHLWRTFLTYPDSSEPLLPEPVPLRDEFSAD